VVEAGGTVDFHANGGAVTWRGSGSASDDGIYHAPNAVPQDRWVTITATRSSDGAEMCAAVLVVPQVLISPLVCFVWQGWCEEPGQPANQQFAASRFGTSAAPQWFVLAPGRPDRTDHWGLHATHQRGEPDRGERYRHHR
jgi:hypothetical protein